MARGFIRKRGSVYYAYWHEPDGKQRSKAVSRRKKDAEVFLTTVQAEIVSGAYRQRPTSTFGAFAERWLADCAAPSVKPSTLRNYESLVRNRLVPHFGPMQLSQITPEAVQSYMSQQLSEKRKAKTALNHLVLLKTILKQAVAWDYIVRNPAEHVKRPNLEHREMDFLTPAEVRLFLDNVARAYRPLFTTAVLTGMRLGELLALQWGDIDWRSRTIHVRRSVYRDEVVSPKSRRSVRGIGMSPMLIDVLFMHKLEAPASALNLVFPSENGGFLDQANLRNRAFADALESAELRKIRIHDLRHTFASLLIHQGENLKYVQTQLGHASIQTTVDRYGHLMPDAYLGASERLDATIFGAAESSDKSVTSIAGKQKVGSSQSLRPRVSW